MTIGALKEPAGERRVAILPEHFSLIKKLDCELLVEQGAGENSYSSDKDYTDAGAKISSREEVIANADILVCINLPEEKEFPSLKDKVLVGTFHPVYHKEIFEKIASSGVSVFSLDMLPRSTRAQSMDVLSSQANIAGYKSIIVAAGIYPKYFPMLMTAAGSIAPAKVLILGAGVAGLQAIATARRLGGVVEVFDTRPAVKEEVQSLGARFVEVEGAADDSKAGGYAVEQTEDFKQRQKERIAVAVKKADIVVTTAQIFGKKAPILITKEMVESMKSGSVIIDIASSTGGNTELTKDNETVVYNGVTIVGNSNLPSTMPYDSSKLYGKNMIHFLELMWNKERQFNLNFEDDLIKSSCITYKGSIYNERIK